MTRVLTDDGAKLLANPVWEAITGSQLSLGEVHGNAAIYDMQVSPFCGLKEISTESLDDLAQLCSPGRICILIYKKTTLPESNRWKNLQNSQVVQMVHSGDVSAGLPDSIELSEQHVDRMIELVKLTDPGPFGKRTIELGHYHGVLENDRLLAMAGERFKPPNWVEISGVCTHPSAQGRGYAAGLVASVLGQIDADDEGAFLHVRIGSPSEKGAIRVYEKIGFEQHQVMEIAVLERI